MDSRPCNALESLFCNANIRFVVGLSFPPHPVDVVVNAWKSVWKQHGAPQLVSAKPPTLIRDSGNEDVIVSTFQNKSPRELVTENTRGICSASASASVTVYANTATAHGSIEVLILNINHAVLDGVAVKLVLQSFCTELGMLPTCKRGIFPFRLVEWSKSVQASLARGIPQHKTTSEPEPVLRLSEVLGLTSPVTSSSGNGAGDVVLEISRSTLNRCLEKARSHQTTLTGLWMACLVRGISEMFFRKSDKDRCVVGISVVVDLRALFPPDERNVNQVQATVTVMAVRHRCQVQCEAYVGEALWTEAKSLLLDMRHRIDNGEAHHNALAMAHGRFDQLPTATVELSNHGIYPVSSECHVDLSQRYDAFEGLSILVCTEGERGACKGTASMGNNLDRSKVVLLMERVKALIDER